VIVRHRLDVETIVNQLKGAATRRLIEERRHPLERFRSGDERHPKAFARGQWVAFLNDDGEVV
ncbi:MAG TPA: hypothetical protein VM165_19545, partial [Planctomycetaceae bacterium]|nr:hypothetical protein [Planctomycetaceae bacterium]